MLSSPRIDVEGLKAARERYARMIAGRAFDAAASRHEYAFKSLVRTTAWSAFAFVGENWLERIQAAYDAADAILADQAELIAQRAALVEALTAYDAKSAECPLNDAFTRKRVGDGPCPRCKATVTEGCGVEAGASVALIRTVRALTTIQAGGAE